MASLDTRRRRTGTWLLTAHVLAGVVVVLGIAAQAVRPLAPDTGPPLPPGTWFDAEHLALVDAYRGPRHIGAAVALAVRLAVPLLVALTPWGRRTVGRVVDRLPGRPGLAAAFVITGVLVATDLVLLPLSFFLGYVHEGAFGFRTQGLGGWLYDWLVSNVPAWVAALALVPVAYAVVRRLPRAWAPVAGVLGAGLAAAVVMAYPLVIDPLTFRTEPLPDGPVRTEVERILERAGEDIDEIYVADASRRTTKHNAYVAGIGATRRIVLYDNLVDQRPPEEIGLIMAHELGHHRNGDLPRGVLTGGAAIVALCYVLAWALRVATRRGIITRPTDPRGAAMVLALVIVLDVGAQPVERWLSRRAEAAADHAALTLTNDPSTYIETKIQLGRSNFSEPDPPWWVYTLWYTHPSLSERLTMGERWADSEP